jgi:hypothetical protein
MILAACACWVMNVRMKDTPSLAALASPPWQGEKPSFSPCQGGDGAEGAERVRLPGVLIINHS